MPVKHHDFFFIYMLNKIQVSYAKVTKLIKNVSKIFNMYGIKNLYATKVQKISFFFSSLTRVSAKHTFAYSSELILE